MNLQFDKLKKGNVFCSGPGAVVASKRTDPEVYAKVLKATSLWPKRTRADIHDALAILRQAIAQDPSCVPARAEPAMARVFSSIYGVADMKIIRPENREQVDIPMRLNPINATPYAMRQPGIGAWMDKSQVVLDDAAEVIESIDDPAFRNPALLVADSTG